MARLAPLPTGTCIDWQRASRASTQCAQPLLMLRLTCDSSPNQDPFQSIRAGVRTGDTYWRAAVTLRKTRTLGSRPGSGRRTT